MGDLIVYILVGIAFYMLGGLAAEDNILTACIKENSAKVLDVHIICLKDEL